jgi:hypothetical protein
MKPRIPSALAALVLLTSTLHCWAQTPAGNQSAAKGAARSASKPQLFAPGKMKNTGRAAQSGPGPNGDLDIVNKQELLSKRAQAIHTTGKVKKATDRSASEVIGNVR